jgi:Zn-finger nucleic acid-binding protein
VNCPRCKSSLIVVEYHKIELDWCPSCEGLWFDRGEMELVATRLSGSTATPAATTPADTREGRLKCPLCRARMDKRYLGSPPVIIADICPSCGGLWLDHGELELIVSQAQGGDIRANPVLEHLRDTFGSSPDMHRTAPSTEQDAVRK